jgi:uncharacterized protein YprB with RNaseH-like and TPR domain
VKRAEDFNHPIKPIISINLAYLCGHNAKEFDIPFLARMIINQIPLPEN